MGQIKTLRLNRAQFSWALYDFANSAFATTVMAGFFPLFFKEYWAKDVSPTTSTFLLGAANSLSSLLLVIIILKLGRVADHKGKRKLFLSVSTLISCLATAALALIPMGDSITAAVTYGVAALFFALALAFYDALIVSIASEKELDWVSGVGYGFGYLGGGLLFLVNVAMTLKPGIFGIADTATAVKISFLSVAAWWIAFSIPLLKWTPEPPRETNPQDTHFREIFKHLRKHKNLGYFLLAYLFYNDAVNTIVKMAVDYGSALGFASSDLIKALLIVQFIGFPAALAMSVIGQRIGALNGIYICIGVYLVGSVLAQWMSTPTHFYMLAVMIGLVQGGVQALSRSHYARFIPSEDSATYFGLFNLSGKFSAILGPILMGALAILTESSRSSLAVVIVFFFIGLIFLRKSQSAS